MPNCVVKRNARFRAYAPEANAAAKANSSADAEIATRNETETKTSPFAVT